MKHLKLKLLIIASSILFLYSCSGGSGGGSSDEGTAPVVVSTSPTSGATDVASGDLAIKLTFDQVINFVTANYIQIILKGTSSSATVSSANLNSDYKTLTISATGLTKGTTYTLTVPAGLIKGTGTLYNKEITLSFTTIAAAAISSTPVDANATTKCKSLYTYLKSVYGTKCLSAAMANVSWNTTGADKEYTVTGKYPAINCYDFIFIYASPANWINYSDITPVTNWANNNGIVSLEWHFEVPKKSASDSTDVTYDPTQTTFRCKNIFTSGSWEQTYFYKQMDKVCAVLLKLQNAGIAAIWRPFHEAAGNTYAKNYTGTAWFWWGYDGATYYVKLWQAMYSYFQQKGIHNLIWIWVTQNYNGDSSQYGIDSAFYPGDNYVDIIGRDLYGDTADQCYTEYSQISTLYPNKMVTLAECGNSVTNNTTIAATQANISDQWLKGCRWLYFMPWYDYNYCQGTSTTNYMCSDSFWKDAMSRSYVIDRSQVSY